MQTKNETDQDVDYMQAGGSGGGEMVLCSEVKRGNIEKRGGMSGHFIPKCQSPWRVTFTALDGSNSASSGPITHPDSLVTLKSANDVWSVDVTTPNELRKAS